VDLVFPVEKSQCRERSTMRARPIEKWECRKRDTLNNTTRHETVT
jgi:hypothetical protein